MRHRIVLHLSDEGYSVSVPGLPGCCSQGGTKEEALANIKDAIAAFLEVANELAQGEIVREMDVAA